MFWTPRRKIRVGVAVVGGVIFMTAILANIDRYVFHADIAKLVTITPKIILPVDNYRFVYTNTPLIQGEATVGSNIQIIDNNKVIATVTAGSDGHFYYKPPVGFADSYHEIKAKEALSPLTSPIIHLSFSASDPNKAILKARGTQVYENDHPFYGNGVNDFWTIISLSTDKPGMEKQFDEMEKAGIKIVRIINYMLRDMKLPDPASTPTALVESGGGLAPGSYVYRYTCANLSKNTYANNYDTAETLPSPATSAVSVSQGQKVTLTLPSCAKSYRYFIYRRGASEAVNSETLLGFAEKQAGLPATFIDDGSYRPANGVWEDVKQAPILSIEQDAASTLPAGDYVYRYAFKQQRKPGDGRSEKFPASGVTLAGPTAQITVAAGQKVKVTMPTGNEGTFVDVFRRNVTDPADSEKRVGGNIRVQPNQTVWYNQNTNYNSAAPIPTANTTTRIDMPSVNETMDNPSTYGGKPFMTGFGNWNEEKLLDTDYALEMAKKHNIRLLFTFVDQHDNLTGGVREIARNCATWDSNFFLDTCSKDMMKQIIDKFTTRTSTITGKPYKDDPAIFAWEFINEPWQTPGGGNFRNWLYEMGYYLKARDPNHMLSSGDDGSIWFTHNHESAYNWNNNHDFVTSGIPDPIDLLTWHGYPEATGFMFNHGYYGEFTPDPIKDAEWLAKYGPVSGPIDIDVAIKQLQLHAHYATMLNKPVVFGEWGVDWTKPSAKDWITQISNAILNTKPDLVRGPNVYPDTNFANNQQQYWLEKDANLNIAADNTVLYKDHSTLKLSPTATNRTIISQKFKIKPNTPYWWEFTLNNPTDKSVNIQLSSYYKNGVQIGAVNKGGAIGKTSGWFTLSQYNYVNMRNFCEFTTPDADEVDFSITFNNGVAGDVAWIGQLGLFELVPPNDNSPSNFSGTGWWAWPDANGLGNAANRNALLNAAINFDKASIAGLPKLVNPNQGGGTILPKLTKVKVTKFHYNAKGVDKRNLNDEYVVIKNIGNVTINLKGWILKNKRGRKSTVKANYYLKPSKSVTIHSGRKWKYVYVKSKIQNPKSKIKRKKVKVRCYIRGTHIYLHRYSELWNNRHDRLYLYSKTKKLMVKKRY